MTPEGRPMILEERADFTLLNEATHVVSTHGVGKLARHCCGDEQTGWDAR